MIEIKSETPTTHGEEEEGVKLEEGEADDLNNNERPASVKKEEEEEEEEGKSEGMGPMETATLILLSRIALFNKVRTIFLFRKECCYQLC